MTATAAADVAHLGNLATFVQATAVEHREAIAHHLRTQNQTSLQAMTVAAARWESARDAWVVLTGCRPDQVEDQTALTVGTIAHVSPF